MRREFNIFINRRLKDRKFLFRLMLIGGFVLLVSLTLPKSYELEFQYEIGKPWQDADLFAPFDFSIYKHPDSLESERKKAAGGVFLVFSPDPSAISESSARVEKNLRTFISDLKNFREKNEEASQEGLIQTTTRFAQSHYNLQPADFNAIENNKLTRFEAQLVSYGQAMLDSIFHKGFLANIRSSLKHDFISLRVNLTTEQTIPVEKLLFPSALPDFLESFPDPGLGEAGKELVERTIISHIQPSLIYNEALTIAEIERATRLVSPVFGKIKANEPIIRRGEVVDARKAEVLSSMQKEKSGKFGVESNFNIFLRQLIMVSLLTTILLVYLSENRKYIYYNPVKLSLIFLILFIMVGAMSLAIKLSTFTQAELYLSFIYLVPTCIVPILISNFFDLRTGFMANLIVAMLGAVLVQRGVEFAFVQIIAGTVAIYSLRRLRNREAFYYALGYIYLAYAVTYIAFGLYSKGSFSELHYGNLLIFTFNIALTIIAFPLIYLFEKIFGLTSDLTYLELLDTNHPLLQALARKATGTFQHSLQVANIAEATINVIGGNALLVHIGALYHDIGKMKHPQYFIENMSDGNNPHEKSSCEESAERIISHVQLGVELAHKYHLPQEVVDFIETHHGTTRVEYFYRVFVKECGDKELADDSHFRYPGPKPFSKETAVLMISDSIEAASRAMKNPTAEALEVLVNKIIDGKIRDKQLENSTLTFKDISDIREVIYKQLLSIYHGRIEYPEEPVPAEAVREL